MTQETPVKVFSLLGAALFSMALLLGVSASNASFTGMETALPDVFAPEKVAAILDSAASGYTKFVSEQLVMPAEESYAIFQDNLNFIIEEAGPAILALTGLEGLAKFEEAGQPQVAGASTQPLESLYYDQRAYYEPASGGFNVDSLYSFLLD